MQGDSVTIRGLHGFPSKSGALSKVNDVSGPGSNAVILEETFRCSCVFFQPVSPNAAVMSFLRSGFTRSQQKGCLLLMQRGD